MKVKDLIEELKKMPQDAKVLHVWDGSARTEIQFVWLGRGGDVITADHGESVYNDQDRPLNAPTHKEDAYWKTEMSDEEKKFWDE